MKRSTQKRPFTLYDPDEIDVLKAELAEWKSYVETANNRIEGMERGRKFLNEEIAALAAQLTALKKTMKLVGPAFKSLMGELGGGPAADWGLVNDCLVRIGEVIGKAGK